VSTYERAVEIVTALGSAGVRASTDPSAINPPAILIPPPARTYDLNCGFTTRWTLVALAAGAQGADRTTWTQLDELVDAAALVVDLLATESVAYTLNGTTYPAQLCTFEETNP
jgi:hypothetical protein